MALTPHANRVLDSLFPLNYWSIFDILPHNTLNNKIWMCFIFAARLSFSLIVWSLYTRARIHFLLLLFCSTGKITFEKYCYSFIKTRTTYIHIRLLFYVDLFNHIEIAKQKNCHSSAVDAIYSTVHTIKSAHSRFNKLFVWRIRYENFHSTLNVRMIFQK